MEYLHMPRSPVTRTEKERHEVESFVQKCGKGHRIRHTQILLKVDKIHADFS